jgi:hypothetical protein
MNYKRISKENNRSSNYCKGLTKQNASTSAKTGYLKNPIATRPLTAVENAQAFLERTKGKFFRMSVMDSKKLAQARLHTCLIQPISPLFPLKYLETAIFLEDGAMLWC